MVMIICEIILHISMAILRLASIGEQDGAWYTWTASYMWHLQEIMETINLTSCSYRGSLKSSHFLIGANCNYQSVHLVPAVRPSSIHQKYFFAWTIVCSYYHRYSRGNMHLRYYPIAIAMLWVQHSHFISNAHLPYSAKRWWGKTLANLANPKQFAKVSPTTVLRYTVFHKNINSKMKLDLGCPQNLHTSHLYIYGLRTHHVNNCMLKYLQ